MATFASLRFPSFRHHFIRSFAVVFVLSLVSTVATWSLSVYLLSGDHGLLQPANFYEQRIPDIVVLARSHYDRILAPETQGTLERVIPLDGVGYQVLDRQGVFVYGSDQGQYVRTTGEVVDKLNTSERVDGRIVQYYPVFDRNGSWCATLVLLYRLTLLGSNPTKRAAVGGFIAANMLAPFLFLLGFSALLARRLGRRLEGPVYRLAVAAERIKDRDLDFTLGDVGGSKEIVQLADAVEEMRSALQQSLVAQWRMEQERRDMIANIAHDLQTPLTVIAGHVDNLINQREKQGERLERYLDTIRTHTERAIHLVNDMHVLAEVDHPSLVLDIRPVNASHFFVELAERFRILCTGAAIRFETSFETTRREQEWIWVDAHRLEQILTNVIENSVRYTHAGGTISMDVRLNTDCFRIGLCDTGPGFEEKDLPHVLDRFYQSDASRSRHAGLGLGLHIVKTLTDKHGGQVEVGNRPEGGARIVVQIPISSREGSSDR